MNARRHETKNRPPTAKALEAVAFGLLGSGKRKGELKNRATSRPSQRARKDAKGSVPVASSGDTKTSCMDVEAQQKAYFYALSRFLCIDWHMLTINGTMTMCG